MYKAADMAIWSGRDDGYGKERWHQCITPLHHSSPPGVALVGVASDTGVTRNHGRDGAAAGPDVLRKSLANLACHHTPPIYDAGNLHCEDDDLETLQLEQTDKICQLLEQKHFPLIIGGGHEIAFGSFAGLEKYLSANQNSDPIGIINLDAHFDLRQAATATSGTPFLQIATLCQQHGRAFNYLCLGINEAANTPTLFETAKQLGVHTLRDDEMNSWQLHHVEKKLRQFIQPCGSIYLSIDLDVLPAATAPGVSAPAARGVSLEIIEWLLKTIKDISAQRLKLVDVAEYNPKYDIDGRTARVAARLCHLLIKDSHHQPNQR